ncbi:S1C family serine protease [Kistimonas asteriae]|uniref:S1C family serine protease n=1 Tax=Kistimonas asteriae TaxID=517724 RepID=UPI001BABDCD2|nr:trypsin-like peptidase domain-containing protein [Kistimonas asteriae]
MKHSLRYFGWPGLCGLLLAIVLLQLFPQLRGVHFSAENKTGNLSSAFSGPYSYNDAVERAAPSVVNIFTTRAIRRPPAELDNPLLHDAYSYDRVPRRQRIQSSLGSGVIVRPEGYILTNNHVIAGADDIIIALQDGRETHATIIGSDPETDLAVLKIQLDNLPGITLTDSQTIRTGDVVLAIGNPFGLGQTVSMGIISATQRNLRLSTYENFIQTDAAINIGNSGGALVNARGELVGISTALLTSDGGSEGLGFAIPSNLANQVLTSIIEEGRVVRGWLGIESQALTPELASAFGLGPGNGILISGIYDNSPASEAGLQRGDVIISINNMEANDGKQIMNQVANLHPGSEVPITVLRGGETVSLVSMVGERPPLLGSRH